MYTYTHKENAIKGNDKIIYQFETHRQIFGMRMERERLSKE